MPVDIKHRTLTGVVVSDKMSKTVVVRVDRLKQHPKYKRRYRVSKKYKAHDEKSKFHVGDRVRMEETRPLSRDKRWRVVEKISEAKGERETTAHEQRESPDDNIKELT